VKQAHMLLRAAAVLACAFVIGAGLAPAAALANTPLVSPAAPIATSDWRCHPDPSLNLMGAGFNVFTDAAMPADWSLLASLAGTPGMGTMFVTINSQVWQHADGHLLFAYQVVNGNDAKVRRGNVVGHGSEFSVIDSGILDYGGDLAYDAGDILWLARTDGTAPQLAFAFEGVNGNYQIVERLLEKGQTSSWFYVETDATVYSTAGATVQDSGRSGDRIPVLVPAPEPATVLLLAAGAVTALVLRRRGR